MSDEILDVGSNTRPNVKGTSFSQVMALDTERKRDYGKSYLLDMRSREFKRLPEVGSGGFGPAPSASIFAEGVDLKAKYDFYTVVCCKLRKLLTLRSLVYSVK
jgi:hypothetical protein